MSVVAVAGLALGAAMPATASGQGVLDLFGAHFGSERWPSLAPESWLAGGVMLVTQYDGRWRPRGAEPIPWEQYDGLNTSTAYNYLSAGHQWVFNDRRLGVFPANTAQTIAFSVHRGFTGDSLVAAPLQTAFHDFRRIPHVFRGHVSDGYPVAGVDVQWMVWPSRRNLAFGAQTSLGIHHRELAAVGFWRCRFQTARLLGWAPHGQFSLMATGGLLGSGGVVPDRVAGRFAGGYAAGRLGLEIEDTFGVSAVATTGLFGERELLMSLYLAARLGGRSRLRLEFVNDLIGGRDRGPTGGGRIVYALRH